MLLQQTEYGKINQWI